MTMPEKKTLRVQESDDLNRHLEECEECKKPFALCVVKNLLFEKARKAARMSDEELKVGNTVRAIKRITEGGGKGNPGDPDAKFPDRNYIHAEPGELGTIEHLEEDKSGSYPTVRFKRTGTSTIVHDSEIEIC